MSAKSRAREAERRAAPIQNTPGISAQLAALKRDQRMRQQKSETVHHLRRTQNSAALLSMLPFLALAQGVRR